MRHFYFSLLLFLLPTMAAAQERDYHPFIEEGKVWVCTNAYRWGDNVLKDHISIGNDTVVNGIQCKELIGIGLNNGILLDKEEFARYAIYEKEGKVYFHHPIEDDFHLLYDFECCEGDVFNVLNIELVSWGEADEHRCTVEKIDTIYTRSGHRLRRYFLKTTPITIDSDQEEYRYIWIEGVGSPFNPLLNVGSKHSIVKELHNVENCSVDSSPFFEFIDISDSIEDVGMIWGGIGNVNLEEKGAKTDNALYDLSGRRVTEPQKGIYIQNGRKRVK